MRERKSDVGKNDCRMSASDLLAPKQNRATVFLTFLYSPFPYRGHKKSSSRRESCLIE